MSSLSADTDAVERFAAQLSAAADELADMRDAHGEAGRIVLAASDPPRRTGALAAGQTVRVAEWGVQLVSTVRYWTFVHYGAPRAGTHAQPWITQAVDRATDQVVEVYAAHARQALNLT